MKHSVSKRELLARAFEATGCGSLLRKASAWRGLLVLNYHRIGNAAGSPFDRALFSATEETFDRQVRFLAQNFDVVGLHDLGQVLRLESRRPGGRGRYVMITFDDGYRDNYLAAYPILRTYDAPAVFFLATGFLDQDRVPWWDDVAWMVRNSRQSGLAANAWTIEPVRFDEPDRAHAIRGLLRTYKSLSGRETDAFLDFLAEATGSGRCPPELAADEWMTWNMVREMRAGGMAFGAHTVHHPVLANLSAEEQNHEICESQLRIEYELGEEITAFSYPVGKPGTFDASTCQVLLRLGFDWAFSYSGGYCRPGEYDRFRIPRMAVEEDLSFWEFRSLTALPQVFAP